MSLWDNLHDERGMVKLEDGSLCESDVLNVIQKINEYDPGHLKVQYLERAAATGDAPWRIIELCKDGEWRVLFYVWQMDERVLERLRAADCYTVDVMFSMDKHNASLRAVEGRRFQEKMGEAKDIVEHVLKSPKGRYTFRDGDKLVTIDDDNKPSWKINGANADGST
jgi:hypothetical protein